VCLVTVVQIFATLYHVNDLLKSVTIQHSEFCDELIQKVVFLVILLDIFFYFRVIMLGVKKLFVNFV